MGDVKSTGRGVLRNQYRVTLWSETFIDDFKIELPQSCLIALPIVCPICS